MNFYISTEGRSMNVRQFIPIIALATPLALILLAIGLSGWFNIVDNALSDLGHATKSNVAVLFNLGLVLGGFLLYSTALMDSRVETVYRAIMAFAGFSLALVGVFDEVYGKTHFIVSIIFFTTILLFLIYYSSKTDGWRRNGALAGIIASVIAWALHFTIKTPPGAAIPELVSIFSVAPFYLDVFTEGFKRR
ncbi:MAG: DUF998 domain-containing protein [Thermosphaera aggregans]|uniref:DUF998 domain-containing protein n=1 Tax=Thermosphaera aggregans TaxID=54254 RepID=UPI003C01A8A9